jgi:hypothetical protein
MADEFALNHASLAEALRFWPRPHWDPVPPFLREHLTIDLVRELTVIQLDKQMRMLEIEQIALKETLNVVKGMRG